MKYIDYFAAPQFSHDPDLFYKTRLLIGLVQIYTLSALIFALTFTVMPGMGTIERIAGILPTTLICVAFIGIMYLVRLKGQYNLASNLVITITSLGIFGGIFTTGGPIKTPSNTIVLLPVFLGFTLLDFKQGVYWACLVFLIYIGGMVGHFMGVEYMMVTAEDKMEITRGFNWVMAFVVLVGLLVVHQFLNEKLKSERDEEKLKLTEVLKVTADTDTLRDTSNDLFIASSELVSSSMQQKTAVEQLSTTSEELSATAQQNNVLAQNALVDIQKNERHIRDSEKEVASLVNCMSEISSLSNEIQMINNVINDISYQTNLLSLNAMIEASRAGEGNGGFKVVATEVQKLAERSADAAKSINDLLEKNNLTVNQGVSLSEQISQRFSGISESMKPLSSAVRNVSDASSEQNEAIKQILLGLDDIDHAITQNQSMVQKVNSVVDEMQDSANTLSSALQSIDVKS